MASGRFFLRWTFADGFVERAEDPLYCINTLGDRQLYFLLGLPSVVLLEVAASFRSITDVAKQRYQSVARELLQYLKSCKHLFSASTSYSCAMAAAMLGDRESTERMRSRMISSQQTDGSFQPEVSELDAVQHTAEISACLCRMDGLEDAAKLVDDLPATLPDVCTGTQCARSIKLGEGNPSDLLDDFSSAREEMCDFESVTLSAPTWCSRCDGFLWGLRDQGLRCRRCAQTVCSSCTISSETCKGALRL